MIFTESTIKISNNSAKMDSTIVLYRGDKNIEIRFTILQSPFKYSNTVATNVIESTNASYGQLVIKTPNDKPPIFSEVSATKEGTILFTITKEMIDEIEEVGVYTFQIRLMDENKQSRVTIPPVENGIEIKEPIAIEDDNTTNVVGLAKANYAVATLSDVDTPAFDDTGKYNKTNWNDGDIITNVALNKIEDGIYTTNENVTATKKYVDDNTVIYPLPIHTTQETDKSITKVVNIMDLIPGVQYSTYKDINQTKTQGYRVVYICDDGTFKIVCTLPVGNKIIHLLKVVHSTNYSTLSYNNTAYKVDYSKHSTNTDIEITRTLQNYIPIANNIEYTPTREYHPATKKYADDKFICTDIVDNVGTISKEEMQKCNNGTSRYVSSIKFKEFFADYEHCIYQGTYGDKKIRMKYDKDYNRMIAYDLTDVIQLGFEFNNNYMYPFNAGTDEVKAYQFTNDLVITKSPVLNPSEVLTKNNTHEYTPTTDYNPATKKYVDDNKITYTVSSKKLATISASNVKLDESITVNNVSINKDRRYYIEFLGSKKLGSLSIDEEIGNAITCSINNYAIEVFNDSSNISMRVSKINIDDTTATTFTNLVIYEEEVKYLDNKYLETDLTLQNSISLGRIGDIGTGSSAIGYDVEASGTFSHAEGNGTKASGNYGSHAEGDNTESSGESSHAEGVNTIASGNYSHAEGNNTKASGMSSHTEGDSTTASGDYAHAEGNATIASGLCSHAEGHETKASGISSHAEGGGTTASSTNSHAEGNNTTASSDNSHAEGDSTKALGESSHAEGTHTTASGDFSHAEGGGTIASGLCSHAEGNTTIASSENQHVQGAYNIEDKANKYAHIVGNGKNDESTNWKEVRSNAHTLDWQGNAWYSGKVTAGAAPVEDMDLTTKKYVDDKISSLPQISFNEAGELVVTINGVSKTFVPKNV